MSRLSKATAVAVRQNIVADLMRTTCIQPNPSDDTQYRVATRTEATAMASVVMEVLWKRGLTAHPYVDHRYEVTDQAGEAR